MNDHGDLTADFTALTNLEAEQAFLGALLSRNDILDIIEVPLKPEHFAERIHARVFEAAATMIRAGQKADPVTLINHFKADATLTDIGGPAYFARLAAAVPSYLSAPHYAQAVHDLYLRREGVNRAQEAIQDLFSLPVDERPADFLAGLAHQFSEIAAEHAGTGKTSFSAEAAAAAAIESAAIAYENHGKLPGSISTGLQGLDEKMGGLVRGDMVIVGARPSMGKTALGLTLAVNAAQAGMPVQFISLEMRAKQLGDRMISLALRPKRQLPGQRFAQGKISEAEFNLASEAAREVGKWPLTIEDRSDLTVAGIRSAIARLKVRNPELGVVIVDYLGLVQPGNRYAGRKVDEIGEISTGLKRIAKQMDVCMVVLHQLSRALESRDNKRPTMADLRDSGAIEQDADIVLFPFREAYYLSRDLDAHEGTPQAIEISDRLRLVGNDMELIIAKNRQGSTGTVRAWCDIGCNFIADRPPEATSGGELF